MAQQRKQDPDRFRTVDVASDGQHDPQYQRMVADIEATQQRQGWLAGRGAFDKDDLLYLRDKEQEQRFQEQYKRDAEAAAFAAARAQAEQQLERQAVAKLRQQDMTLHDGVRAHTKGARLPRVVSVKPSRNSDHPQPGKQHLQCQQDRQHHTQHSAQHANPASELDGHQPSKRQRVDADTNEALQQQNQQQQNQQTTQASQHHPPDSAFGSTQAAEPLQSLLADYGSEDDTGSEEGAEAQECKGPGQQQQSHPPAHQTVKVKLPSAAELLQSELKSTVQTLHDADQGGEVAQVHVTARQYSPAERGSWV